MKQVLTVTGLVGLLVLVLTVRTFAAPALQPLAAVNAQQVFTTTPPVGQTVQSTPVTTVAATVLPQGQNQLVTATPSGQRMGMHGGMMGGGKMGGMQRRMGMHGGMNGGAGMRMQWQMNMSGPGGFSMTHEMMFGVTPMHDDIAMQLGMTTEELYNHMASGKSLVQIAAEKGITEQQLIDNIMADRRMAYDQAVKEGHMSQAQADAMLQNLNNNLKMMVNGQGSGATGWGMRWNTQPNTQATP